MSDHSDDAGAGRLAAASVADTLRVLGQVVLPIVAQGVIVRRPRVVAALERARADDRGIRLLQRLHATYAADVLRLRVPGRHLAVVLDRTRAERILAGAPEPYAPSNVEKRAALARFQPNGVLISPTELRPERRAFTDVVLEPDRPTHRLAGSVVAGVRAELDPLRSTLDHGTLTWAEFSAAFDRAARRIVLGSAAADDVALTDQLAALRRDANWAYLRPRRRALRERFLERVRGYVDGHEPGSLAGEFDRAPSTVNTDPAGQVPHWLFAYDAAAIATFRALALLATHPEQLRRARAELVGLDPTQPHDLPFLRACILESVRLWPTTLVILRDTTVDQAWVGGRLPARTALLLVSSYLHRDERTLSYADEFTPELWLDGGPPADPALVPFSAGPAVCPGRNLVLLTTSTVLATLLATHDLRLLGRDDLDPRRPLPRTLGHHNLRFAGTRVAPSADEPARPQRRDGGADGKDR